MGRGRKANRSATPDKDRDAPVTALEDTASVPLDDAEGRAGIQWANMQDPESDDERPVTPTQDDPVGGEIGSKGGSDCANSLPPTNSFESLCSEGESAETRAAPLRPSSPTGGYGEQTGQDLQAVSISFGSRGEEQRWQELLAEAAGAEIEAMHWDRAGSSAAAIECYRQVAVKLLQAAESLGKDHSIRKVLEHRSADALERIASLEASQSAPSIALEESLNRDTKTKLTTQGILASTLASNASSAPDGSHCKSSLRREDAKVLGVAATIGGAAGLLLAGPISAAALGATAAYATTREDPAGAAARKVCTTSIGVADNAVNKAMHTGLKAADIALEEGRRRLIESMDESVNAGNRSRIKDWCSSNKDKCIRAVAAVEALQSTLPRHRLSEEARRMKTRYPDRVPVLCERGPGTRSDLPDLAKKKFAVPEGMLFGEFKYIVHKQVTHAARGLSVEETLYLFVGEAGVQPKTSATMAELSRLHGAEDGFVYVRYTAENTLGRNCACT